MCHGKFVAIMVNDYSEQPEPE